MLEIFFKKFWKQIVSCFVGISAIALVYFKGRKDQKGNDVAKEQAIEIKIKDKIIEAVKKDEVSRGTNRKKADAILNDPTSGFID